MPLTESISSIDQSLAPLPQSLTDIAGDLNAAQTNLQSVDANLDDLFGLTRSVEDARREIALLDAMIAGLSEHRPEGFGGRVEDLRGQQHKLQTSLDGVAVSLDVLSEVIAEKEGEI